MLSSILLELTSQPFRFRLHVFALKHFLNRSQTALRWMVALFAALLTAHPSHSAVSHSLENISESWEIRYLSFAQVDLFQNSSVGRIESIAQSPNGLIWIGTHQGLFRYDGRHLRSFLHDPLNPRSIPDDSVCKLHIDAKGRLWVGTQRGLALYDSESEQFTRYLKSEQTDDQSAFSQVNGIAHNSNGTVFATTELGWIYEFDEQTAQFSKVNPTPFGAIKSMSIDPLDRIWIGSNGRLDRFSPSTLETRTYQQSLIGADELSTNYLTSIIFISDEEIWMGTTRTGLLVLDSIKGRVEQIPYASQQEAYVNQIGLDNRDRIWAASNEGLCILDRETKLHLLSSQEHADEIKPPPSGINALFVDHQGTIWAGSNYDGISKSESLKRFDRIPLHELNPDVLPDAPASAFLEDKDGNLWIAHPRSGVSMYPKSGDGIIRLNHNRSDPKSISDQPILKLFEDSNGSIWIGTFRGGLFSYDPNTKKLKAYLHDPANSHSISGQDIRDIAEDAKGNIWVATHGNGVSMLDRSTGQFENYTVANRDSTHFFVPNDWINTILFDKDQNIWLSARNGATRIGADRQSYSHFTSSVENDRSLSNSHCTDIFEDSKGRIWIATKDGLNLFMPETESFKTYSVSNGMPDRSICSIIEDKTGILWLGTLGGLARFDPETEVIQTFNSTDGLASDDFFEASAFRGADGTLYFGQNKGLTRFNPREIVNDLYMPPVFITGIRLFDIPLQVTQNGPLKKSLFHTSKLSFDHNQNAIVFEFVAIDYKNPAKNKYRYRLEGFDKQWSNPSNRAEAIYTNLPSGNFVFRVQATNIDSYWNEAGDSLAIQIVPPFWSTLPFRVFLGFIIVTVPVLIFVQRTNSMRNEARRLEAAVEERTKDLKQANKWLEEANARTQSHGELLERTVRERTKELKVAKEKAERSDKLKSAFLANMSHEIRTPMNAIIGFLHILENKDISDEEREQFHSIIHQSSKSLMSLIDDILDLSAIEAGEAEISMQPSDIDQICKELSALFRETLAVQKKGLVAFEFERNVPASFGDAHIMMTIDPLRLKQILWNFLSNALKFTESGKIRLRVSIEDSNENEIQCIHFSVQDTGIGIPKEEHQRIFNRFHKLDKVGKKLYRGTGLGLTITHTLTKLMKGDITLESEPGVGTTFHVTFPVSQDLAIHPKPSDSTAIQDSSSFLSTDFSAYELLVVEDEPPNFDYIDRVLKKTGVRIQWAKNGTDALSLFQDSQFDLVLLDLKIPEVDGYEVAAQIRKINPLIPIVAQSAYAMREDEIRSKKAGANEHLAKPFSPDQLINILAKYLKNTNESPSPKQENPA